MYRTCWELQASLGYRVRHDLSKKEKSQNYFKQPGQTIVPWYFPCSNDEFHRLLYSLKWGHFRFHRRISAQCCLLTSMLNVHNSRSTTLFPYCVGPMSPGSCDFPSPSEPSNPLQPSPSDPSNTHHTFFLNLLIYNSKISVPWSFKKHTLKVNIIEISLGWVYFFVFVFSGLDMGHYYEFPLSAYWATFQSRRTFWMVRQSKSQGHVWFLHFSTSLLFIWQCP